jgi:hypothetical protein
MTETAPKLVFHLPSPQTPGFAKRMKRAAHFMAAFDPASQQLKSGQEETFFEDLIDFLAVYCEGERKTAIELLWDATEEQFMSLLKELGAGTGQAVPPTK